ncbi:transcription antitermination factor NusB [Salicibibacter halophilus]|uniref:Transcription antitermination protein NusB n=1 Tax=Salicibibacter halophilus TaxID=2502791 RepID=A0A514LDD6_9BACI|nr:transcription antitermination factor NusB [Salicibibacter halophilus]QDI89869.1 transcription antitermination factor NusB [Salicibibacter halophilus]
MNRRWARIRAVQALYQVEMTGIEWKLALQSSLDDEEEADDYLYDVIPGVLEVQQAIDAQIAEQLEHWTLERVGNVDRAVMRLAVYEMQHREDIPVNVALNEAINTAKAFGGNEAGKFVNGVLSNLRNEQKWGAKSEYDSGDH